MPKEHKKRGRREEEKRKREEEKEEEEEIPSKKRQKSEDEDDEIKIVVDSHRDRQKHSQDTYTGPNELPFYGLLSEDEQEYFKRADSLLELNQFGDTEERNLFLANVYREANGRELKIANSQSCSRLMERLILMSSPAQLKALFQKFNGQSVARTPNVK